MRLEQRQNQKDRRPLFRVAKMPRGSAVPALQAALEGGTDGDD